VQTIAHTLFRRQSMVVRHRRIATSEVAWRRSALTR